MASAGLTGALFSAANPSSRTARLVAPRFTTPFKSSSPLTLSSSLLQRQSVPVRRLLRVRAARMESPRASLGFRAPHFELPEPLTGKVWTLDEFESYPALLVMFICNHCPFVKHLKKDIAKLTSFYMGDGPEFMAEDAKLFNYPFPYLFDETQEVARAFRAVCTPEFFLFKKDGRRPFELFYHGQFDESRPKNNIPVTGRDLSLAIDCVLSGQHLSIAPEPSIGCSIKWHPGKSS